MKKCRLLCVADASVLIDFLSVGMESLLIWFCYSKNDQILRETITEN